MSFFTRNSMSTFPKQLYNQHNKQLISADYAFDLTQSIGKRPVFVVRQYENQQSAIFHGHQRSTNRDYTCQQDAWKWNCY